MFFSLFWNFPIHLLNKFVCRIYYLILWTKKDIMKIRAIEINTTAYAEENLMLVTDLTEEQIIAVIQPLLLEERAVEDILYTNEDYIQRLRGTYAENYIESGLNKISI